MGKDTPQKKKKRVEGFSKMEKNGEGGVTGACVETVEGGS